MSWIMTGLGLCGMASCVSQGVCAAGRLCCCAVRSTGKGGLSPRAAKAGHIMIIALSAILALILYNYGDQISFLQDISAISNICNPQGAAVSQCYGASAVLRISLALCLFFAVNMISIISADSFVGWWAIKILLWIGLVIGCFFIPTDAIAAYGKVNHTFVVFDEILLKGFSKHIFIADCPSIFCTVRAGYGGYSDRFCLLRA